MDVCGTSNFANGISFRQKGLVVGTRLCSQTHKEAGAIQNENWENFERRLWRGVSLTTTVNDEKATKKQKRSSLWRRDER